MGHYKKRKKDTGTYREDYVKTRIEVGVTTSSQCVSRQQSKEKPGWGPLLETSKVQGFATTLITNFWPPEL